MQLCTAGVPRLYDLIKVREEALRPAFYYALGNTLVAGDLEQASRIAYGGDRRWSRVVTLQACSPMTRAETDPARYAVHFNAWACLASVEPQPILNGLTYVGLDMNHSSGCSQTLKKGCGLDRVR